MNEEETAVEAQRVYGLEQQAQHAAEARIMACMDELHEDDEELMETVACAPFCGCYTCIVREIIDAAWPALYEIAHSPIVPKPEEGYQSA
jgi:hypothetical protein